MKAAMCQSEREDHLMTNLLLLQMRLILPVQFPGRTCQIFLMTVLLLMHQRRPLLEDLAKNAFETGGAQKAWVVSSFVASA